MFDPSKFTVQQAKPMPVLLLLDVSGSMYGAKMDTLNEAVRTMLDAFVREERNETSIIVSIITFGEKVLRLFPFTPASEVKYRDLNAGGGTPLGTALEMAKAMIEDKDETPGRAYRPLVVLVSDGQPNIVDWRSPLEAFITQGRSSKCDRMAMAIGTDADRDVLGRFIAGTGNPLFEAHEASEIKNFFKMVTMSVTTRTTNARKDTQKSEVPLSYPPSSPVASSPVPQKKPILPVNVTLDGPSIVTSNGDNDDDSYF